MRELSLHLSRAFLEGVEMDDMCKQKAPRPTPSVRAIVGAQGTRSVTSQNTFSTAGSLFSFSKSKKLISKHVLQLAAMTNNLSARNDRNNDLSLQDDQQCFCVRFGLETGVGKHSFELC